MRGIGSRLDTYGAALIADKAGNEKAKGPQPRRNAEKHHMHPNVCLFFNLSHF